MKALRKSGIGNCQDNIGREPVQFRMINLNLFWVFDAMMQHRNVQAASRKLSVTPSAVSHALEETINLAGRPTVRVSHFAAVVPLLRVTDMVAVLPRRLARLAAVNTSIALLDLPYPTPKLKIGVAWHQRADHDQGIQWLLNELVESIGDVE